MNSGFWLILVWTGLTAVLAPWLLRRTILGLRPGGRAFGWWSILLYLQFVLVLLSPPLIAMFGVGAFPTALFVVTDAQTLQISLVVLYASTVFFIALAVTLRLLRVTSSEAAVCASEDAYNVSRRFAFAALLAGMLVMLVGMVFLHFHNALIDAALLGKNLWDVRRDNKYFTDMPSIMQNVMTVSAWITAIHAGFAFARCRRTAGTLYVLTAILLAGAPGGKGPIVMILIVTGLAYAVARQHSLSLKIVIPVLLVGFPLAIAVMYFLVAAQDAGMTVMQFGAFLANRLGVGQMAGTYDGLSFFQNLGRRVSGEFWLDIFPLSHSLIPHLSYAKALMMDVENRAYDSTGVKNSFFVSEAFGMGGWTLVAASPVIVGISFGVCMKWIEWALRKMFTARIAGMYFVPIALLSQNVTGGFSQFPLLRGFFTLLVMLVVIAIPYHMIRCLGRRLPSRERGVHIGQGGTNG